MIFLTVGTQFPFDRLVKTVDKLIGQGVIEQEIWAQIGDSSYQPSNFKSIKFLEKDLFDEWMQKASKVISHAGIGVISAAFDNVKPMLVMPRLRRYGEVVNNHQVDIARKFEQDGHLLAAYDVKEMPKKIIALRTFVPKRRQPQVKAVVTRISLFLNDLYNSETKLNKT